jgi:hypothetical protein
MMQVTQPGHQRGFFGGRLIVPGVLLCAVLLSKDRTTKGKWNQDERQESHGFSPQSNCVLGVPKILHPGREN